VSRSLSSLRESNRNEAHQFSSSFWTGFSANYFSGRVFVGRPDITSTFGSFVVGVLGGIYGRFTRASAFVVIVSFALSCFSLLSFLTSFLLIRNTSGPRHPLATPKWNVTRRSSATGFRFDDVRDVHFREWVQRRYSAHFRIDRSFVSSLLPYRVGFFLAAAAVNIIGGRRSGSGS